MMIRSLSAAVFAAGMFGAASAEPQFGFADSGRYLPPVGLRYLAVETTDVTNLHVEIRRVMPRNLVQLLAREEDVYRRYWGSGGNGVDTLELSGDEERFDVKCRAKAGARERNFIKVGMKDGGPRNGIFLVQLDAGDEDERRFRTVCVSDLGLSVRRSGATTGVWVTSLTSGKPVAGAKVEIFSKANVLLASGTTDADGWCDAVKPERYRQEPFAIVVRSQNDEDMTFLALHGNSEVDELQSDGWRPAYLTREECSAHVWTERGIYRHGDQIFVHALVRDRERRAPKSAEYILELVRPDGKVFASVQASADEYGAISHDGFSVPDEQASGRWEIRVCRKDQAKNEGLVIGEREIRVEEFAPPRIRTSVTMKAGAGLDDFGFVISSEHLFGGAAANLACEGAVAFEDVPFTPAGWDGWRFGDPENKLQPNFKRFDRERLDERGSYVYDFAFDSDWGQPAAAVKVMFAGTVFEDGGRPVSARGCEILHRYPYYLGSPMGGWVSRPAVGGPVLKLAAVKPDGSRLGAAKRLKAKLRSVTSTFEYRPKANGWGTWDCIRSYQTIGENLELITAADGTLDWEMPIRDCGDYVVNVEDPETGVSFSREFYLGYGDGEVRSSLRNPTKVGLSLDKDSYRVDEDARLVVKSPFTGYALLAVMREGIVHRRIFELTNATSVVELVKVPREWAPNVDVSVSVIQSVEANAERMAVRAHGETTLKVRPLDEEVTVKVSASHQEAKVSARIEAPGAERAVVTLVDEGINFLTEEPVPDPIGFFARLRRGDHPLFDLYGRILPVCEESLQANGIKTGGGGAGDMFGRVSPVKSRRFRPLACWKQEVVIRDGVAEVEFPLPEFAGEVRVTALAYSKSATGAAAEKVKVRPKLVLQCDAPRFVAPGDEFETVKTVRYADGSVTNIFERRRAPAEPGEQRLAFVADGEGEHHEDWIDLPVRPAVAWKEEAGVMTIAEWEAVSNTFGNAVIEYSKGLRAQLSAAYRWLAEYPHGCLEQTASRIFPLLGSKEAKTTYERFVESGVRRVESMMRENDFVMWPDCDYTPWNREVSLYAAHFLIEADRLSEVSLSWESRSKLRHYLEKWAMSDNNDESAYACHNLALWGRPEKDRMYRLYDSRDRLSLLARVRLARAFALVSDRKRAEKLLDYAMTPASVKEAAFALLAVLEMDENDERAKPLVAYLLKNRDAAKFHWGTTDTNAHALLALGAYRLRHPETENDVMVSWHRKTLPRLEEVKDEIRILGITRRYYDAQNRPADLTKLKRGDALTVELALTSAVARDYSDLVIEDLLPGCFEPENRPLESSRQERDWVMRSDLRDDRVLVFSKRFRLEQGNEVRFRYGVRVVSAGDYTLPGPSVEAMYAPGLGARRAPGRVVVIH